MAVTIRQHLQQSGQAANPNLTLPLACLAGSRILLVFRQRNLTSSFNTNPNTMGYADIGSNPLTVSGGGGSGGMMWFWDKTSSGGTEAIAWDTVSSNTWTVDMFELTGGAGTLTRDGTSERANPGAQSTHSAPALTPAAGSDALVLLFSAVTQDKTLAPIGSTVEYLDELTGAGVYDDLPRLWTGYISVTGASGSYQPSYSCTTANNYSAFSVSYSSVFAADFSGTPLSGDRPLSVQFTDLTGNATSWEWDFGDSNVSTEQHPEHTYAAAGTYTVTLLARNATDSDSETKVAYITVSIPTASDADSRPSAGFWIDWDNNGFASGGTSEYELARMLPEGSVADDNVTPYLMDARWQRGGQADLIGGQTVGTLVATLKNTDGRFTPDNTASPLYGKLDVGRRVWLGAERTTATFKGLWAGYIKEIVPVPRLKQVQVVCHDVFGMWQEARVRVPFSTARTALDWRNAVLDALGLGATQRALAPEPYELAVSGADVRNGLALLDELNQQTGSRHLIMPADDKADFYRYVTVGRNQNLGIATPPVTLTEDDITNMAGYRQTNQTIINYQQVTPHQVEFSAAETLVWEYADVPFAVGAAASRVIKANFSSWVTNPRVVTNVAGVTIVNYGRSAELTMLGSGTVTRLEVWGYVGEEPGEFAEFAEDVASQVRYEVIREGTPIDADLIRSAPQALGVAQAIIARSSVPRTRPQVTFRNRFDRTLSYDHGDVVMQTLTEFGVVARRYEIVGVSGAISEAGLVWDFGWTYLETPYQVTLDLFTLNESALNGTDILGF